MFMSSDLRVWYDWSSVASEKRQNTKEKKEKRKKKMNAGKAVREKHD